MKNKQPRYTLEQRIAITECLKLSELCAGSKLAVARTFGIIVLKRARGIWSGTLTPTIMTDAEIAEFVDMVEGWTTKPRKAKKR